MQDKQFPSHEAIAEQVLKFVELCFNTPQMHNRESLDMLIADLKQYRSTIPTCDEYMEVNLL
jgi:hypothetical protein